MTDLTENKEMVKNMRQKWTTFKKSQMRLKIEYTLKLNNNDIKKLF